MANFRPGVLLISESGVRIPPGLPLKTASYIACEAVLRCALLWPKIARPSYGQHNAVYPASTADTTGLLAAAGHVYQFVQRIGRDQDTAVLKRPANRTVGCQPFESTLRRAPR